MCPTQFSERHESCCAVEEILTKERKVTAAIELLGRTPDVPQPTAGTTHLAHEVARASRNGRIAKVGAGLKLMPDKLMKLDTSFRQRLNESFLFLRRKYPQLHGP